MFTGSRALVLFVGVPLVIVAGFLIFLLTRTLVGGGDEQEAISPSSPVPVIESSAATASTSASGPPPIKCGEVLATDAYGSPLGELEPLVRGIHDTACRRDYPGLLAYMEDSYGGFPKEDVVAGWQRQDSDGSVLRTLVETLETRAVADQGGRYFCHPRGAVAVFARGTHDRPGSWSEFDPTGALQLGLCEVAR